MKMPNKTYYVEKTPAKRKSSENAFLICLSGKHSTILLGLITCVYIFTDLRHLFHTKYRIFSGVWFTFRKVRLIVEHIAKAPFNSLKIYKIVYQII